MNDKKLKFDQYALWNLIYSICWAVLVIYSIIWGIIGNNDARKALDIVFGIIGGLSGILFIINLVFSIIWTKKAIDKKSTPGIVCYILGIFIAFVGFVYDYKYANY